MKFVMTKTLIDAGGFSSTDTWKKIDQDVRDGIDAVRWPVGGEDFAIFPESGKKRGEGNGVVPIKTSFQFMLLSRGWRLEERLENKLNPKPKLTSKQGKKAQVALEEVVLGSDSVTAELAEDVKPGAFDAWIQVTDRKPFVVEWETGNVSSSHRSLNKMAMGVWTGFLEGGILVVPNRKLARWLTDRIGNYEELRAYFPFWSSVPAAEGYLGIYVVEHDRETTDVPRIPKGKDGRALG